MYRTCIHKFDTTKLRDSVDPKTPCAILSLVQSPAIDVVAIGFSSGEISVYDIRADERLLRVFMDGGGVRALGFRSGLYYISCIPSLYLKIKIRWEKRSSERIN